MSPLDITFVVPSLVRGGAERVTVNLANGLAAHGDRVRLIITGSEAPFASALTEDVGIVLLERSRVRRALPAVVAELRRARPDVVVSTHTHVNLALCAVQPLLPSQMRLVLREPTYAPVELAGRSTTGTRLAQRLLYRRASVVLASSDVLADHLARITRTPIERLENPVDVEAIRGHVTREESERTGRRFVSVGRLHPQKATDELIQAFAVGSDAEDILLIIGDGSERTALELLIEDLGLRGRVVLLGHRDDHWSTVATADAFLLASRNEGMPNAVLEALALGTPVLATDELTVLGDLASEVGDGLLLAPRAALAEAIGRVASRSGPFPGPSLLPDRFDERNVVTALRRTLLRMRDGR